MPSPEMTVLWQAIDGADAIRRHDQARPDILLLDIQMPTLDGLTATQRLIAAGTSCKIIVLTTFDSDEYVLTAIEAGAAGSAARPCRVGSPTRSNVAPPRRSTH